jgi:hypothetical protein
VSARRAAPPVLAALAILLLASVGSSGAEVPTSACPPAAALPPVAPAPPASSPPAPDQTLVCVAAQAITGQTYSHWLTVSNKDAGPPGKGQPPPSATELRNEVLGFLISSEWVKGEAAELGVRVSAGEVRKNFDHIRNQQFPKRGEFERFLRQSGETVADLLFRVELNLLSQRVQKHVLAAHHSASSKERALSPFVKTFKARWQAQTYCAAQYAVADCGHVLASL